MRGRKRPGAQTMSRREQRLWLRLLLSALLLLLAVGGRLLLPERMAAVQERFARAVSAEMDVQEVFAAVGRAVSGGEEDGWDGVYRAVFAPQTETSAEPSAYRTGESDAAPLRCYDAENTPGSVLLTQELLGFAFASPLAAATVSSPFGLRNDPFTGAADFHYGMDLAAAEGTAVTAFAAGMVRTVGDSAIWGNYLILDHAAGYSTLYAHCSRILRAAGEHIELGDTVAEVGQSGSATGPHLHFELHRGSRYLNPVYYLV